MPNQSQAVLVLARWREIERALQDVADGTPEAEVLLTEAMRLRDEYQVLIEAARANHRPEPPAFPAASGA